MKLAATVLAALVSLAGIATADDYAPQRPTREQRMEKKQRRLERRARRIQKVIRKYDLNHDGVVDRSELPPRLAARMQKLDRNHDGWVDANDLDALGIGAADLNPPAPRPGR